MKIVFTFFGALLSLTTVLAGNIVCSPTIGVGDINFSTVGVGLNRIAEIEVATGKPGAGGYGIVLTLKGTKGTGELKADDVTIELPWSKAFGSALFEYSNGQTSKSNAANPFIRFEMEELKDETNFLAALTYSSVKDANSRKLLTSRYNCKTTK